MYLCIYTSIQLMLTENLTILVTMNFQFVFLCRRNLKDGETKGASAADWVFDAIFGENEDVSADTSFSHIINPRNRCLPPSVHSRNFSRFRCQFAFSPDRNLICGSVHLF